MLCGRNSAAVNVLPPVVMPYPRLLCHVMNNTQGLQHKYEFILVHNAVNNDDSQNNSRVHVALANVVHSRPKAHGTLAQINKYPGWCGSRG